MPDPCWMLLVCWGRLKDQLPGAYLHKCTDPSDNQRLYSSIFVHLAKPWKSSHKKWAFCKLTAG